MVMLGAAENAAQDAWLTSGHNNLLCHVFVLWYMKFIKAQLL